MDALDVAILALRLALVLVLYLFLVVVVRLAARGLQAESERPAARQLRLRVLDPGDSGLPRGRVISVPDGATLGRAERAVIVVADPAVSAEHVRLVRSGTRWIVADLGSTNGTLVNDTPMRDQAALAPGDVLGLGNVRLQVVGP